MTDPARINVLFAASEAVPFIKVGGLGDVAGSLPRALMAINDTSTPSGLDVRLVIPFHPAIRDDLYSPRLVAEFPLRKKDGEVLVKAYQCELEGLPVYLIKGIPFDEEDAVYSADLEADGFKYIFFSLACLELARQLKWQPDILHANDWHTATAVYILSTLRDSVPFISHTRSLITIHNLPYLGAMTASAMDAFDVPEAESPGLPAWAQRMALPLGLLAADSIVAVSPTYAREILSEEFGSGLQNFLKARSRRISGILNGLDTQKWDPASDTQITVNFSSSNLSPRLQNKSLLQQELGLEVNPQVPLLAMVTRLDPQKGVDISVSALRLLLHSPGDDSSALQAVFLGTGDPVLENSLRHLEHDYPGVIRAQIMYDEALSHHIYAGADMLLMPSRYEPCGVSQMIAMRYGCVPIARATGGLSDTITDPADTEDHTGFLFKPAKPEALAEAIQRALQVYRQDTPHWEKIQLRGMQQDFSWDRSAREYLKRYKMLVA